MKKTFWKRLGACGFVLLILSLCPAQLLAQTASDCLPAKNADPQEVSSREDPGALRLSEMAACISSVDGNFAWLRDVVLANDVEWLDRGYRGTYVGTFTKAVLLTDYFNDDP